MGVIKNFLVFFITVFFFSNFVVFGFIKGIFPFPPLYSILIIFACTLFIALSKYSFQMLISNKIQGWILFYALLSIGFGIYGFYNGVSYESLEEKMAEVLLCILTLLIVLSLCTEKAQFDFVLYAIMFSLPLGVAFILIDLFIPLSFSELIGRGAGMYLNANYAGAMLVLGVIYLRGKVSPAIYFFFLLIVGIGVVATFSRSAMAFFFLYIIYIYWKTPKVLFVILSIAVVLFSFIISLIETQLPSFVSVDELLFSRFSLLDFSEGNKEVDFSTYQRKELLSLAINDFFNSPIIGGGLGKHVSTTRSEFDFQQAHNIYIVLMVDYGYIGILIMPLLLYSIFFNAPGSFDSRFIIFTVFIIINGFVSHNMLDHYGYIFFYGLFAAERLVQREGGFEMSGQLVKKLV